MVVVWVSRLYDAEMPCRMMPRCEKGKKIDHTHPSVKSQAGKKGEIDRLSLEETTHTPSSQ